MTTDTTNSKAREPRESGEPRRRRNPLEPLSTVTSVLLGLIVAGFALVLASTIFGTGSILGFGRSADVCADTGGLTSGSTTQSLAGQTRSGISLMTNGFRLCADNPTTGQRLWYTLQLLPGTVLTVGGILLVYLLVRNATRHGIYTGSIAGRLRILGWFLLAGSLVQSVIVPMAAGKLLDTMITGSSSELANGSAYELQWPLLLTGFGVLTFARIMRIGVTMQEDLEGTV